MDMLPENLREILQFNPLVPILNMARDVVLYDILPTEKASIYIVSITAVIFVIGYAVFKINNKRIVEEL